jgi:serine/threonine protein kinase
MATFADPSPLIETKTIKHGDNEYTIENVYGEGNFGKVYKCSKNNTCEKFAIKQIKIKDNNPATLTRIMEGFKKEYELLVKLENICKYNPIVCIIEHFKHENDYYIVMEDLFSLGYNELLYVIRESNEISIKIMNKLCESILQLHSIKDGSGNILVHRDIKMDNIMYKVDKDENISIKFIDFGASCFDCSTTPSGALIFTDPYLLNKIIDVMDGRIDKNTKFVTKCDLNATGKGRYCYEGGDIYSMGIIFVNMILKSSWVLCIPRLDKMLDKINHKFEKDMNLRVKYTTMIIRYFIGNFVVIENAIDKYQSLHPESNIYNIGSIDENKEKFKSILNLIDNKELYGESDYISFVPIDKDMKSTIEYIDYDIRKLIITVFTIKGVLSKLDYDLNLFSLPINKRYIKKKSGEPPSEIILLPPPPPPHPISDSISDSPTKKRHASSSPSRSPSRSSHKKTKYSGGKRKTQKNKK